MKTQQQIEAEEALKKTQEQLEKEEVEETQESTDETPEEVLDETQEEEVVEETEETQEEEFEEPKTEEVDYKKKFSESSREAQKIIAKNRKLSQAIDDANEIPDPTDEEMSSEFADWDIMSDTEKKLATEAIISKRYRQRIAQAREETKRIEKWNESVDAFLDDPKTLMSNPLLEGKVDEFRVFASEESHTNVPFDLLVKSFLYDKATQKKSNKGKMMETGTGGPNDKAKQKGDTITLEEAHRLMKTNYAKYKQYLLSGKIKNNIV